MFSKIAFAVLLLCHTALASAAIVNFDDLDASGGDLGLDSLSPYQGFTWTNFSAYTNVPGFPGFNNGIVSLDNAAYSGGELFGATVTPVIGKIEANDPFDFVSAYLGSGYYDDLDLTVQGRLDGSLLFTSSLILNTTAPVLINFAFTGIDELDFPAGAEHRRPGERDAERGVGADVGGARGGEEAKDGRPGVGGQPDARAEQEK